MKGFIRQTLFTLFLSIIVFSSGNTSANDHEDPGLGAWQRLKLLEIETARQAEAIDALLVINKAAEEEIERQAALIEKLEKFQAIQDHWGVIRANTPRARDLIRLTGQRRNAWRALRDEDQLPEVEAFDFYRELIRFEDAAVAMYCGVDGIVRPPDVVCGDGDEPLQIPDDYFGQTQDFADSLYTLAVDGLALIETARAGSTLPACVNLDGFDPDAPIYRLVLRRCYSSLEVSGLAARDILDGLNEHVHAFVFLLRPIWDDPDLLYERWVTDQYPSTGVQGIQSSGRRYGHKTQAVTREYVAKTAAILLLGVNVVYPMLINGNSDLADSIASELETTIVIGQPAG